MATADDYVFEEGVLYHLAKGRARSREAIRKELVKPRSLKDEVVLAMQEEVTSGYLGFEKKLIIRSNNVIFGQVCTRKSENGAPHA